MSINPVFHVALLVYLLSHPDKRKPYLIVPAAATTLLAVCVPEHPGNVTHLTVHIVSDCVFGIGVCVCWNEKVPVTN